MAKVERIWFCEELAGLEPPLMYGAEGGKGADSEDLVPEHAEQDYARLVEEIRLAEGAVVVVSLDTTFTGRDTLYSLRSVYLHMIAEYARHTGHADFLRERLDGVTAP